MTPGLQLTEACATQPLLPFPTLEVQVRPSFPDTKYMGSKQALLPFILRHISALRFERALDAFSGSGCVAYAIKQRGAEVHANDFLKFAFHFARATVQNNSTVLSDEDVKRLTAKNTKADDFIQATFGSRY